MFSLAAAFIRAFERLHAPPAWIFDGPASKTLSDQKNILLIPCYSLHCVVRRVTSSQEWNLSMDFENRGLRMYIWKMLDRKEWIFGVIQALRDKLPRDSFAGRV